MSSTADGSAVPLPAAVATGIGSMPGTSSAEATAIVAGELPDLPHLPELPARGAGADIVGRTAALLAQVSPDLAVETTPTGWRLAGGATRDSRRARSWLQQDADRCEEVFGGSSGWFKTQLCGPWTLAAAVESPRGGPALRDAGLVAEIGAALTEAAADHVADLRRRLPRRDLFVQLDEPSLPAVLDGRIASASGFTRLPAVAAGEAASLLQGAVGALRPAPVALHCCAAFPFAVARAAGCAAVSWDISVTPQQPEAVAAAFEAGLYLMLGAVPTGGAALEADWRRILRLWRDAGLAEADLAQAAVTPACGLAGTSPAAARATLAEAAQLATRAAGQAVG